MAAKTASLQIFSRQDPARPLSRHPVREHRVQGHPLSQMTSGAAEFFRRMGNDNRVRFTRAGPRTFRMAGGAVLMHRSPPQIDHHVGNMVNVSLPPAEKERSQDGRARQAGGSEKKMIDPAGLTVKHVQDITPQVRCQKPG